MRSFHNFHNSDIMWVDVLFSLLPWPFVYTLHMQCVRHSWLEVSPSSRYLFELPFLGNTGGGGNQHKRHSGFRSGWCEKDDLITPSTRIESWPFFGRGSPHQLWKTQANYDKRPPPLIYTNLRVCFRAHHATARAFYANRTLSACKNHLTDNITKKFRINWAYICNKRATILLASYFTNLPPSDECTKIFYAEAARTNGKKCSREKCLCVSQFPCARPISPLPCHLFSNSPGPPCSCACVFGRTVDTVLICTWCLHSDQLTHSRRTDRTSERRNDTETKHVTYWT